MCGVYHTIAATALHLANAYAAFANGGVLLEPKIVKSIDEATNGRLKIKLFAAGEWVKWNGGFEGIHQRMLDALETRNEE